MASIQELADAAVWLASHVRLGMPVGMEYDNNEDAYLLCFAGSEFTDQLALSGTKGDEGTAMFRRLIDSKMGIQLAVQNTPRTVSFLAQLLDLPSSTVLDHIAGDADSISYVIGAPPDEPETPEAAAQFAINYFQAAKQMKLPAYYQAVSVPLFRMLGLPPEEGTAAWEVSYPALYTRVIAKYSNDPAIMRSLQADEEPLHFFLKNIQTAYDDATYDFAFAALLWAALGGDTPFFQQRYPQWFGWLEGENFEALGANLDKIAPAIRLMAQTLWGAAVGGYGPYRDFQTLYGRSRLYVPQENSTPGPYLDFVLGGTVEDICNVAAVTFHNLGASVVPSWQDDDAERHVISGTTTAEDPHAFLAQLKQVVAIGGPLNPVPLSPTISLEPRYG